MTEFLHGSVGRHMLDFLRLLDNVSNSGRSQEDDRIA